MANIFKRREAPIILFTIVLFCIFSLISSNFLKPDNLGLILTQITTTGLISIGMLMVILFGGIDLSVGSVLAVVATVVGMLVNAGINPFVAALIGMVVGAICGAFNGLFIAWFNIPEIITTLATMFIFRGIAVAISGGEWVTNFPDSFNFFSQGKIIGIPVPIALFATGAIMFGYILSQTRFGRRVYAIGGNKEAAKLAGMSTRKTKFLVYISSGMLTSVAAVIYASQVGSIQASTAGSGIEFTVIAAVLVGGASIFGGVGTMLGTAFGVLLMGMIKNGLVLTQASVYWVDATTGFILILAIIINTVQRSRNLASREGDLV
ncbi:ABC transporter permease [Aquibacillus koreensis]|uniref:Autoinducer 2 import system permease protein LsrC n=1 Tax=Aquibacillus koreensis TaxID=279446 RepID=A0A9X3WLP5_9BACI|nr:ABC transporter permease [Aquibacillus koreensis]MCT2534736.1 ABC transporter permease [Aquibacillus koreensis]MDC3419654.1 ABC transporter permease [Aquibacillus koreensis]